MIKRKIISVLSAVVFCMAMLAGMPVNAKIYTLKGDVNADGEFGAADLVTFQKWLLGVPDVHIEEPKTADFYNDSRLDAFDVTLMRKAVTQSETQRIESPSCKAAVFACADSGELLYCDNINERIAPASLTKLLTASVALQYLNPDTVVTVGSEQDLVKEGSSLCYVKKGQKLKLYDLLTGMLMSSGNDAAYTAAVTVARAAKPNTVMTDAQAVDHFAKLMNDYAVSLGMKNSHFVNPEGWDDENQYTTVSDLLILADHVFSVPEIKTITGTYQKKVYFVSGENAAWTNTNALLDPNSTYYCADAFGMKTGFTANAGNCLIAAFEQNGKTYLSAVVGCDTDNDRYELTLKMLSQFADDNAAAEKGYGNGQAADVFKMLDSLNYHAISCDGLPTHKLTAPDGTVYFLHLDDTSSYSYVWRRPSLIVNADNEAPLTKEVIDAIHSNWDKLNIVETDY